MLVTTINEKNEHCFDNAVGSFFKDRGMNDIFLGLVDDEDRAAGAAVLQVTGETADLKYLAIADEFRGRGYGRYFVEQIVSCINESLVSDISLWQYLDEEETETNELVSFLTHMGFEYERIEARRSVYDLHEVLGAVPFAGEPLPEGYGVLRPGELGIDHKRQIKEIALGIEDGVVFDEKEMTSGEENKYGSVLTFEGKVCAMLQVSPFMDGVRIAAIYAHKNTADKLPLLFDKAADFVREEGMLPEVLYIDSAGRSVISFEDNMMKKKGISAKKHLYGVAVSKKL